MKKFIKIFGIIAGVVFLLLIAGFVYLNIAFPRTDPPMEVTVELTEARIERGEYLANHVTGCINCHSKLDQSKFGTPVISGTEGKSGERFDQSMGLPGIIYAKNITPASLGTWSDGELIRATTCGVNKDNEALFPLMPYPNYNQLSEEDLYSIVAYIRTLKPIEDKVPETELNFPVSLIVKTIPFEKYEPKESVSKSDQLKYGKYLTTMAFCSSCHTPRDRGEPIEGMEFAGRNEIKMSSGIVRSANITPDTESGIGNWTKEVFIKRFKYYDTDSTKNIHVGLDEFNSPMPWISYAGMTEEDLVAIYEYLKTIKPVKNRVEKWTPIRSQANN